MARKKKAEDMELLDEDDAPPTRAELAKMKKAMKVEPEPEEEDDYVDQDSEFGDMRFLQEESGQHRMFADFTGGEAKGMSGKTDITAEQRTLLTQLRALQGQYEWAELGLDEHFLEWFEVYGLSVDRGSRKETVEMFRGTQSAMPPVTTQMQGQDPARFQ